MDGSLARTGVQQGRGHRRGKKNFDIVRLLGFSLGCVRLSYDDFCRLTVEEFESVCKAYTDQQKAKDRADWERIRILAAINVQPHTKKKITPQRLLPFPWDKKTSRESDNLTFEERKKRCKEAIARMGETF